MKKAHKLLILLLLLATSIGFGITYSEARVCFIVGGCGKAAKKGGTDDSSGPTIKDCYGLGYQILADGFNLDKDEAGTAKYKGVGEKCTNGGSTYFKKKACKSKYKYLPVSIENDALAKNFGESLCGANATGGGDSCVETYELTSPIALDVADIYTPKDRPAATELRSKKELSGKVSAKKFTQCVCDAKYKYVERDIKPGFEIDSNASSCVTSGVDRNDGLPKYDGIKCSLKDGWKETCGTKEHAIRSETWGDLTCNLCSSDISKCTGANQYASMGECYNAGRSNSAKRYTCELILVDGTICYEMKTRSCADMSYADYYMPASRYYSNGYYNVVKGRLMPGVVFYDTLGDCMDGIDSEHTCLTRTLSDGYYSSQDSMTCYYREKTGKKETCADHNQFESVDECLNAGRGSTRDRYTCKLVATNGLACYERAMKTCADFAAENKDDEYYGYYDYYGKRLAGLKPIYFETEAECLSKAPHGQTCEAKVLWSDSYYGAHDGKTCYYRKGSKSVPFTERVGDMFTKMWDGVFGKRADDVNAFVSKDAESTLSNASSASANNTDGTSTRNTGDTSANSSNGYYQ